MTSICSLKNVLKPDVEDIKGIVQYDCNLDYEVYAGEGSGVKIAGD